LEAKKYQRDEGKTPQQKPDAVKSKGAHIFHAGTLGNKGETPYTRGKQKQQIRPQSLFVHGEHVIASSN
jgi:hypothetical protein